MKTIEFGDATITITDEDIVLFEANAGKTVDSNAANSFYNTIEKSVSGEYSLIVHRKEKYLLMRVEVFNVINSRNRLKSIAIVAEKDSARKMAKMEAPLCQKPFEAFSNIDNAIAWSKDILQGGQ